MNKVAVIDYGMGNLHSVTKAIEYVGRELDEDTEVLVTSNAHDISQSDRVVFPGVGAIRDCMAEIKRLGIDNKIQDAIKEKPILAICVGMQALMKQSEENHGVQCIGLFDGRVKLFGDPLLDSENNILKVPHMGWNQVRQTKNHALWRDIPDDSRFYFVHSYYAVPARKESVYALTDYEDQFASVISKDNLIATQFHPEKSGRVGLRLLSNFLRWQV